MRQGCFGWCIYTNGERQLCLWESHLQVSKNERVDCREALNYDFDSGGFGVIEELYKSV